jgi:hypothetical protein
MLTALSLVMPLPLQSWWICDSHSERLYTVCQDCGEESSGVTLHTVPVRHTWMRDRYELWLKYLETLRVPKSRAKMRLVSKA